MIGEDHDPETHLLPLVLDAATGKRDHLEIFGTGFETPDGASIRDYIHVTDLENAHLLALGYLLEGGQSNFFNYRGDVAISVLKMCDSVISRCTKWIKLNYQ